MLLALSAADISVNALASEVSLSKTCWQCGHYPLSRTSPEDHMLLAELLEVTHGASSASWVRLHHAASTASAARASYAAADMPALKASDCDRAVPFVLNDQAGIVSVNLIAVHPGHDNYRGGEYIAVNIRAWAQVAAVVSELALEPGAHLTVDQAEAALSIASTAADELDLDGGLGLQTLTASCIRRLVARGHARPLLRGPHAEAVREALELEEGGGVDLT